MTFFENPITYRYPNYALFWLYHISPLEKSLISNEKTAVFSAKRPRSGSVLGKLDVATHIAWSYLVVLPSVGWWKKPRNITVVISVYEWISILVGGFDHLEKYESQLGLLIPIYGKIQMFQTTNQY